jgi:ankyrin repeat protein
MLAIEHDRTDVANYLLENYQQIDLESKDGINGNSALHIACLKGNNEIAGRIFKDRPKLCLKQNYLG